MNNILLNQDLSYYQSLLTDQLKDIIQNRSNQRREIEAILKSRIPSPLERLLTRDQIRLYRLYQMSRNKLTEQELINIENIANDLKRWQSGGCYNLNSEYEKLLRDNNRLFSFTVPNISVTFCIDVAYPIQNELVNVSHKMVDVFIENYRYPLDQATSQLYLDHLSKLGVDPLTYPQMKFLNLDATKSEIQSILLNLI